MTDSLLGKVSLVTGSGLGIGRASALAFAREGAKVVVADISPRDGKATTALIKDAGGDAFFIETDVTRADDVANMVKQTVAQYGQLDCAHNNVGIGGSWAYTADQTEADWDKLMSINLKGIWLCLKYEIKQMLLQEGGSIVNTSSMGGLQGTPFMSPYVASKYGVNGLTKTAAMEYASSGIRVNAVCPGAIYTPGLEKMINTAPPPIAAQLRQVPEELRGRPESVAEAVVWLCSPAAAAINGEFLTVAAIVIPR